MVNAPRRGFGDAGHPDRTAVGRWRKTDPTLRGDRPNFKTTLGDGLSDVVSDDLVILHLQYSTQWDSLAHVGALFDADGDGVAEKVFYNGFSADEMIGPDRAEDAGATGPVSPQSTSRATRLGIENMAAHGVQGRGVMIDLHAHFGREHRRVGHDDLMRVMDADSVTVEEGDIVCLHTGFAQLVEEMAGAPDQEKLHGTCCGLDGRDEKLRQWISDSGLAALVADNYAVEMLPAAASDAACCADLPLHEHCLFKNGIPLGELWRLTALAEWLRENGRNRFLLTAPPLRLPGAVGSPVTPIATV